MHHSMRELKKQLRQLETELYQTFNNITAYRKRLRSQPGTNFHAEMELDEWEDNYERLVRRMNEVHSKLLIKEAATWGIEVGNRSDWYTERTKNPDPDKIKGETILVEYPWLNETGKAVITKQIRDARFAYWKGWAEILVPVLSLVVAIIALLR